MKIRIFLGFLLLSGFQIGAAERTNAVFTATNTLAIHLVAGSVPRSSIIDGTATPEGLKLKDQPILSDADFVAWNVTNHSFVITPAAAMRLGGSCMHNERPFVLLAKGEPVYLGMFGTSVSSSSAAVPVILTDLVVMDCFMGITNVPDDVWRMIGRGDPGITDRLLAITNATTNVTLQIDRGYPPPDGFGRGADLRGDKRIAAAVDQLFGKKK